LHRLHDGIFGYSFSETEITFHELAEDASPTAPPVVLPLPFPLEGRSITTLRDGCLPVFSFHVAPGVPPFSPGPCAFYVRGGAGFTILPGSWDRCLATGSDMDGLRFSFTLGATEETRRVGVDGTFLDREPLDIGPPTPDLFLSFEGIRTSVFIADTFDRVEVVPPTGPSVTIELGPRVSSISAFGATLFWVASGTVVAVAIDERGAPRLPPDRREGFGPVLSLQVVDPTMTDGERGWLVLERTDGVELLAVDRFLARLGAPIVTGLLPAADAVPTARGLVVAGESPEGTLIAVPYECAE
jgi:hypothetical protein